MDVCHQRQLGPMRAEKRRVPRGVSEVHVLGNRMADAGEVGEQHHERDIRIDFANPVRDLGTEIHEERMLGLRVDKAGKISSEHHWDLRHRQTVDCLPSFKGCTCVARHIAGTLLERLGRLYLDFVCAHRGFVPARPTSHQADDKWGGEGGSMYCRTSLGPAPVSRMA